MVDIDGLVRKFRDDIYRAVAPWIELERSTQSLRDRYEESVGEVVDLQARVGILQGTIVRQERELEAVKKKNEVLRAWIQRAVETLEFVSVFLIRGIRTAWDQGYMLYEVNDPMRKEADSLVRRTLDDGRRDGREG